MNGSEDATVRGGDPAPLWDWSDDVALLDSLWRSGGIVAVPTESSYGLAVDPADAEAVSSVFRVKGRRRSQPLPVVAGSVEDLLRLGVRLDLPELAPATTPGQAAALLAGERAAVVDGGALPGGLPSTIVGIRDGRLAVLREGRFPPARLFGA